ncbi:MAG TPA: FAD-dependent monooxygenase [Bryobacteraceae bacterium]
MQTQVGIIGGRTGRSFVRTDPAPKRDRFCNSRKPHNQDYVIDRVRAGVLEQFTADLMTELGAGDRLQREGMRHDDVYVSFGGRRHLIPLAELTAAKAIYVYGQNEVVKDLMNVRVDTGRPLHYEVSNVSVHDIGTETPRIRYRHDGSDQELACDFIAGCDGFTASAVRPWPRPLGTESRFMTEPIRAAG